MGLAPGRTSVVATALLLASACPAVADDDIGLSADGRTWTTGGLHAPLFDPAVRWVPGDVRTASFFVRNRAEDGGVLEIDLHGARASALREDGDVLVETRVGDAPWSSSVSDSQRVGVATVAPGETDRVDVRVTFSGASTNVSQLHALDLDLTVTLSEDLALREPDGLPDTGSAVTPLALLAAVAGLLGSVAVVRRRRTQEPS